MYVLQDILEKMDLYKVTSGKSESKFYLKLWHTALSFNLYDKSNIFCYIILSKDTPLNKVLQVVLQIVLQIVV